jgi:hypothetical protein
MGKIFFISALTLRREHESLIPRAITFRCSPFVRCQVCNKPEAKLTQALTAENTPENNKMSSHAQDATEVHHIVLLTGLHQLLFIKQLDKKMAYQTK